MHILITADLHSRRDWFDWLLLQRADLTIVAGDLLDGFRADGLLPQMLEMRRWFARFPGNLVLCSGNHDHNNMALRNPRAGRLAGILGDDHPEVLSLLSTEHWMDCVENDRIVTDRRSKVVMTPGGRLAVTTIPYDFDGDENHDDLWEEGARLQRQERTPWLVLHHEPPAELKVGGRMGNRQLYHKIQEYQPDFVFSGHLHDQPYDGSFADRLGGTWCFNPGHPMPPLAKRCRVPNHIVLDLADQTATWHASQNIGNLPVTETIHLG